MSPRVGNTNDVFCRLLRLVLCITLQFPVKDKVLSAYITSPSRGDFATCKLTEEEKETFLIEHNKFRGMVKPTAADMEYLVGTDQITGKNNKPWGLIVACDIYMHGKFSSRTGFQLKCIFLQAVQH